MGIDLPELDDREYEDLLEQAQKLIPAYSEEWTDFNPHDPGITILEILAWLTETHTYQLDQITDEHREKYLQLIGHRRQPPSPASATITLQPPAATAGTRLPAGTRLGVTDGTDDLYQFETDRDVCLTTASVDRVRTAGDSGVSDHDEANETAGMFYLPFGSSVTTGQALYLGFDADPLAGTDRLTLFVSFHDENLPAATSALQGENVSFSPSVDLDWAYFDPSEGAWRSLAVVSDETNSFYEGGLVELELAGAADPAADAIPDSLATDVPWVRCRVENAGYEIPPQVETILTNTVSASHAATVTDERLQRAGATGGRSLSPALDGQTYTFDHQPVLSATVSVDGREFTEVSDFDASGPDDRHYVLDRQRGEVTFGDGTAGRAPPADATVTADYVYGGGTAGNVSAAAVWRFTDSETTLTSGFTPSDIDVSARGPATGGENAETVTEALRRARRDLRRPYRAVTADDYQYLAAQTPGLRIGRTGVWFDDQTATVIVVPYAPPEVHSPTPSDAFLETVRSHLRERTLLTDRVDVSGPRYVRLEITVSGTVREAYAQSGYESAVTDAVESYLHPLYGYDGDGWPFGRSVTEAELVDEIAAVDAIDSVSNLRLTAHGGTALDDQTVAIDETALFSVETVSVDMTTTDGGT